MVAVIFVMIIGAAVPVVGVVPFARALGGRVEFLQVFHSVG